MSTERYQRYQEARDTAWRALLRLPEKKLPVDVGALAKLIGMDVLPFPDGEENPRLAKLLEGLGGALAISLRIRGKWQIFLREDALDDARRRFAVAHELGHLLLGHETRVVSTGVRAFESEENEGDVMDDPEDLADYAADIFAVRLLSPACVLHELGVDTPGGIGLLCGLPPKAAAMRADRMELLNERDAFFKHDLERQVRDQFLPFLRSRQLPLPEQTPPKKIPLILPVKGKEGPEPEHPAAEQEKKDSPPANGKEQTPSLRPRRKVWLILPVLVIAAALIIFLTQRG